MPTENEKGSVVRTPGILERLALARAEVDAGCDRFDEAEQRLREALKLIGEPAASNSGPPAGTVR